MSSGKSTDAVRFLQEVFGAYAEPIDFKPGDLVQSRKVMHGLSGKSSGMIAAGVVLIVVPDRRAYSQNLEDDPVPSVCVAVPMHDGVFTGWYETWQFERYTGPMPDAH
jgi:hypothetical protein